MRSSNLLFLSFGTLAAGFRFDGVPSTAIANAASSATLIRDNGDSTSFSLLLRLTQQNGGSTIKIFQSEQGTNIPFSFTPTQTGTFIIEVISNLQPISDTQEPDKIFASSSSFTVAAAADDQSSPPPTTSSDSASTSSSESTSSSSQNQNTASSTNASGSQSTAGGNSGNAGQSSSTTSASSTTSSSNGSSSSAASSTNSTPASATNGPTSTSGSASGKGALGSPASETSSGSTATSTSGSSGSESTAAYPDSTKISPGSTGTPAPSGATSKSSKTGMIVGIVFGVLAFIAICLALLLAYIRYQRRKRTSAFERQLMFRQVGSSPLVFSHATASSSVNEEVADGNHEYSPSADMVERGRGEADPQSVYSEKSVPSVYSDSPSIFYTAVPRAVGASVSNTAPQSSARSGTLPLPPVPIPTHESALGLRTSPAPSTSSSSLSTLYLASASTPAAPALPVLAPGWVFPRDPAVRRSQLPPPKTDRQMDILDRKVRLQGKLIGMQGWGNMHASESEMAEMAVVKEQIRRLELLENSDWALGRSDELPAELL